MTKQLLTLAIILFFSHPGFTQTKIKTKRAEFDSKKIIEVKLGRTEWNKHPDQIENGVVVLRDGNTSKTMQVLLEETAPDAGIFSGTYSISWGGGTAVKPEVYVLDQSKLASEVELKQILADIASGKLKRKPLFFKKSDTGVQTLEVFDTKEQAQEALGLLNIQNQKGPGMDVSSVTSKEYSAAKAIMDSQEMAKFSLENEARKKDVQRRLIDRYRFEQTEKLRIEKYRKEFAALSEADKQQRISHGKQFAESAIDFYKLGQYAKAEEDFRKAFLLDPNSENYYFQYGLSLYKSKKYNAAAVVFNILKDNKEIGKEALYYKALCQYSLKEYEVAVGTFTELKQTNDEKLAPIASFYIGLIYYDQKIYEKAKPNFEDVLDTSKDPKLDQKAENYIDVINQVIAYAKLKEKKIFLSASFGTVYDSNVLEQSDASADQGGATEQNSLRYILGLGAYYRGIFTPAYEFGAKVRTDYIYTQNSDATEYDPWSIQLNTPFAYKSALFGKSYKLDLKPGYEILYLGQDAAGDPEKTLTGYFLDAGNTFIMKDDWFTTFTVSFRKDSFIETPDKDATKMTFKWSNMLFINEAKTKGMLIDVSYAKSSATVDTNSSVRNDLSAMYITPVLNDKATFAGGLGVYRLHQPGAEQELNQTLSLTLTKPLKEWLSGSLLGTYVMNDSKNSLAEYDKWTIGFVLAAEYGF